MLPRSSFSDKTRKVKDELQNLVISTMHCKKIYGFDKNMAMRPLTKQLHNLKESHFMLKSQYEINDDVRETVSSALIRLKRFTGKLYNDNQLSYDHHQMELERITELQNAIFDLRHHIDQRESKFDLDKRSSLQSCQRVIDEQFKCQFDKLKQELSSTLSKLDFKRFLQARTSDDNSLREIRLQKNCIKKFEEELGTITDKLRTEKKEWETFLQGEMDKEQAEFKISLRQTMESEFKKESQRNIEIMVSQAKLACLEDLKLARQAKIEDILADAKKQWNKEHERDISQLTRKRKLSESELSSKNEQLCECEKQLGLIVSKMDTIKKLVVDG